MLGGARTRPPNPPCAPEGRRRDSSARECVDGLVLVQATVVAMRAAASNLRIAAPIDQGP